MSEWYPEYVKFIDEMRFRPFAWGSDDCGPAWAGRLVEIITGENPVKSIIGSYRSERGAIRKMREMGYTDLKSATSGILDRTPQHPSKGAIGDLALIKDDSAIGYAFGVVNGERVFFRTKDGIGTVDLLEVECIYKL